MPPERVEALSFSLDGDWYCVDFERVATVVDGVEVMRVEAGPTFVHGTASYGGETLLVIDVARLFGDDPPPGEERDLSEATLVVFDSRTGDQVNTWAVDRTGDRVAFDRADVTPAGDSASLVHGIATVDGRPLTWVDASGINP